jgi:hypothetical protein
MLLEHGMSGILKRKKNWFCACVCVEGRGGEELKNKTFFSREFNFVDMAMQLVCI